MIYCKDIEARKTLANKSDIRIMGLKSEAEALGKDDFAFFPKERAEEFFAEDKRVIETGEPALNNEGFHQDDKGQSRYFITSKYPLRDKEGKIIGLTGIGRDITEHKKAEDVLKQNETRLREAQAIAHLGNWEIELLSQTVTGSEEAARIFGVEAKGISLPLDIFQSSVLPQYKVFFDFSLKKLRSIKNGFDEIYQIKRINDGVLRWVHSKAEIIEDSSGKPIKIMGTVQDISEWKNTEEALRVSQSKFQIVFMNSLVATSITSLATRKYVEVNDTFIKNTEYTREEIIGKTPDEIQIFLDEDEIQKVINDKKFVSELEIKIRRKNGEIRSCIISASIIHNAEESFILSNIVDITERKLAEKVLQENEAHLRELNAAKDKFFSIIAHDLKSPFNVILGFSEILSTEFKSLTDEERITFIKGIDESSHNAYDLLENLLEWSRLHTEKMILQKEKINLLLELHPTISLLKHTAENKQIEFVHTLDNSLVAFADKYMLATIIRNLISNAIKFTNPGGNITLSTRILDDFLEISISDTGVGITKENIDQLFMIDKCVSTKGTATEKGTGLGLLLCKEMIEKHDGKIWVKSKVGEGTTFSFSLHC